MNCMRTSLFGLRGLAGMATLMASVAALPATGQAQDPSMSISGARAAAAEAYWTPARMAAAKPLPMPVFSASTRGAPVFMEANAASQSSPAFDPLMAPRAAPQVFGSSADAEDAGSARMVTPQGYPFTSRRVTPDTTVTSSPYRRAGKLFFSKPNGNFVCSASIINRRVVITAGHCMFDRATKRFYTNFRFVPAYNGTASPSSPYCQWTPSFWTVPTQWSNSSGYPTTDDFGVMVMRDMPCNGSTKTIGTYLGWFGWQTFRLLGNNVTQLGYPGNLDSGQRMQISQSNVYRRASFAGEIGSAQGGGTSGGPWIQNFGVQAVGQVAVGGSGFTGTNQVVAVSSYGNTNHNPNQYIGASVLNSNFVRVYNTACARNPGNC